jgi:hypothetical protein
MKWIRGPWWDNCWFLGSAPLLGLLMVAMALASSKAGLGPSGHKLHLSVQNQEAIKRVLICVNLAHTLSPIVLAWGHDGFRGVMLARPQKFIGVPVIVMMIGLAVALSTWRLFPSYIHQPVVLENLLICDASGNNCFLDWASLKVPAIAWGVLYVIWNLYHVGAQNFGFLCLFRRKGFSPDGHKYLVLAVCVLIAVMIAHETRSYETIFWFCFGLVTINHWTAAIGLSSHVYAQHRDCSPWMFVTAVGIGGTLIGWAIHLAVNYSARAVIMALALRAALGMWHFLQDRWIWKMSNPQVRATIGKDLFAQRGSSIMAAA